MDDYSRPLGDAVKQARTQMALTQTQLSEITGLNVRTIMNIENYSGNPKLETLFSLIRFLKIDAREVFYPEIKRDSPAISQLRYTIEDCSEREAATLIPVVETVLSALRSKDAAMIE